MEEKASSIAKVESQREKHMKNKKEENIYKHTKRNIGVEKMLWPFLNPHQPQPAYLIPGALQKTGQFRRLLEQKFVEHDSVLLPLPLCEDGRGSGYRHQFGKEIANTK